MPDISTDERRLALEGVYNLRDLGGYSAAGGLTRRRTILRADSPHRLSPAGRAALRDLGLRTVIDLRRDAEVAVAPPVFAPTDGIAYRHIPLQGEAGGNGPRPTTLRASYSRMLAEAQPAITSVLRTLAEPGALPALVHCTAGKDRTGLIVALLLRLAGVAPATIAADYALSAHYLGEPYRAEARLRAEAAGIPWEQYQQLLICPPELMLDTLDELDRQYGGVHAYLHNAGLSAAECDRLRNALTEQEPA